MARARQRPERTANNQGSTTCIATSIEGTSPRPSPCPNPRPPKAHLSDAEFTQNSHRVLTQLRRWEPWLRDGRLQLLHRGTRGCSPDFADSLELTSLTRRGRLFVDGEHLSLPLALGQTLELRGGAPLQVVGDLDRKRDEFLARYRTT